MNISLKRDSCCFSELRRDSPAKGIVGEAKIVSIVGIGCCLARRFQGQKRYDDMWFEQSFRIATCNFEFFPLLSHFFQLGSHHSITEAQQRCRWSRRRARAAYPWVFMQTPPPSTSMLLQLLPACRVFLRNFACIRCVLDTHIAVGVVHEFATNVRARIRVTRVEPKIYLANERTFINWLSMAVKIGSVASALAGNLRVLLEICARCAVYPCVRTSLVARVWQVAWRTLSPSHASVTLTFASSLTLPPCHLKAKLRAASTVRTHGTSCSPVFTLSPLPLNLVTVSLSHSLAAFGANHGEDPSYKTAIRNMATFLVLSGVRIRLLRCSCGLDFFPNQDCFIFEFIHSSLFLSLSLSLAPRHLFHLLCLALPALI